MPSAANKLLANALLDPTWKPAGGGLGLFPIGEDEQGNVGFGLPGILRNPLVAAERRWLDTLAESSGIKPGDYLDEGTQFRPMSQPTDAFDAASLAPIAGVVMKAARPNASAVARVAEEPSLASVPLDSYPPAPADYWFHGTQNSGFDKYVPDINRRPNGGFNGVSVTPYPSEASSYSYFDTAGPDATPGVYPLKIDVQNPFVWDILNPEDGFNRMDQYFPGMKRGGDIWTGERDWELSNALRDAGFDAIDIVEGPKMLERAVIAPGRVRSALTGEVFFSNPDEAATVPLLARALEGEQQGLPALPRVAPSLPDSAVVRGPVFKNNTGAPGFALEETNAGRALPTDPRRFSAVFRDAEGVPRGSVSYATDKDGNLIAKNAYGEEEEVTLFVDPEYRGSNVALGLIKQMLDAGVRVTPETLQALSFTRQGAAFANRTLQRLSAADPVLVRQYLGLMSNPDEAATVPLLARALEGEQQGFTAYHGSPHDFDRFDLSKIGTGEGAQAYGHGLYFAENEGVARAYRDNLGDYTDAVKWKGEAPPSATQEQLLNMLRGPDVQRGEAMTLDALDRDLTKQIIATRRMEFMPEAEKAAKIAHLQKQREELAAMSGSVELNPPGRMYEVRIKADPESFLDWDKPLSQQSDEVRQWINDLPIRSSEARRLQNEDMLGEDIVTELSRMYPDKQDASTLLREAGIPGIRYLDQGSRTAGEGSRNFVVFDDSLIEILRKYSLLGAMAGGASLNSLLSEQPEV